MLRFVKIKVKPSSKCEITQSVSGLLMQVHQGSHRLEKYLNIEGFLEKYLKIKSASKNTGKSLKGLEKFLKSTILCRTKHC